MIEFFFIVCYNYNMDEKILQGYLSEILSGDKKDKFNEFYKILCFYNQQYNLTRIIEREECNIKHFLDSICAEKYFSFGANVIEIGSGAGFPSIPLKFFREDLSFTLVESVGKKCNFLQTAVKELDLKNVKVLNIRAEDGGKDALLREKFDICCARAVARLNTLSEYCVPFIKVGGKFIAYKGDAVEEIQEAKNAFSVLGVKISTVENYQLLQDAGERTLIVAEKFKKTDKVYPRGNGKERKKPL